MKELARFLTRNRVSSRSKRRDENPAAPRKGSRTFLPPEGMERPPEAEQGAQSVYRVPDSWEIPTGVVGTKKLKDHEAVPIDGVEPEKKPLPHKPDREEKKSRRKTRRHSMSFAVSVEEEEILKAHAYSHGMSFSEWARSALFRAMQKQIPSRHN
jgi:hypothetical protein